MIVPATLFRNVVVSTLFLALVASGTLFATGPGSRRAVPGITISSTGPASAGTDHCVTVASTGDIKDVSVLVELNGVPLSRVTVTQNGDGTLTACFPVPTAGSGGSVTVTASGGGNFASEAFVIT